MPRYSRTERLGVNKTEEIILKEFDWIFREQSLVDVGIDAIVEKVINGEPVGRFIAVQIKTGASHFNINKNSLTLYVSHIHYNYWLHLNIPIFLVAHLPDTEETFWQHIDTSTLYKTKTGWKLKIPKTNIFGRQAKEEIAQKLSIKTHTNQYSEINTFDPKFDSIADINSFTESTKSLSRLSRLTERYSEKLQQFAIESQQINKISNNIEQSFEREKHIRVVARHHYVYSKKSKKELEIFSEFFAEGLYYYEQAIRISIEKENTLDKEDTINTLRKRRLLDEKGVEACKAEREYYINVIKTIPYPILKEGIQALISLYEIQIQEFTVAVILTGKLIESLEEVPD